MNHLIIPPSMPKLEKYRTSIKQAPSTGLVTKKAIKTGDWPSPKTTLLPATVGRVARMVQKIEFPRAMRDVSSVSVEDSPKSLWRLKLAVQVERLNEYEQGREICYRDFCRVYPEHVVYRVFQMNFVGKTISGGQLQRIVSDINKVEKRNLASNCKRANECLKRELYSYKYRNSEESDTEPKRSIAERVGKEAAKQIKKRILGAIRCHPEISIRDLSDKEIEALVIVRIRQHLMRHSIEREVECSIDERLPQQNFCQLNLETAKAYLKDALEVFEYGESGCFRTIRQVIKAEQTDVIYQHVLTTLQNDPELRSFHTNGQIEGLVKDLVQLHLLYLDALNAPFPRVKALLRQRIPGESIVLYESIVKTMEFPNNSGLDRFEYFSKVRIGYLKKIDKADLLAKNIRKLELKMPVNAQASFDEREQRSAINKSFIKILPRLSKTLYAICAAKRVNEELVGNKNQSERREILRHMGDVMSALIEDVFEMHEKYSKQKTIF